MKLTHIVPACAAEERTEGDGSLRDQGGLVLLARSQGYDFCNKLVTAEEARAQLSL